MTDPLTNLFSTGPNRSIRAHEPQIHWPTVRLLQGGIHCRAGDQVTALIETAIMGAWLIAAVCYAKRM
jgi:hypothetical protein